MSQLKNASFIIGKFFIDKGRKSPDQIFNFLGEDFRASKEFSEIWNCQNISRFINELFLLTYCQNIAKLCFKIENKNRRFCFFLEKQVILTKISSNLKL